MATELEVRARTALKKLLDEVNGPIPQGGRNAIQ
jgi:hypothetical protein